MEMASDGKQIIENRARSLWDEAVCSYSHAVIEQHRCFPYKQNKGCGEAKKSGVIFRIIKCTVLQYISYILM
jgi:hypothetical protein